MATNNLTIVSLAESQSPQYVRRESFRLKILRAKQFNVVEAGHAMFHHFSVKQELFGDEKLATDITMKDLDKDDTICLRNGHIQILPIRDQAGRYILAIILSRARFRYVSNVVCRYSMRHFLCVCMVSGLSNVASLSIYFVCALSIFLCMFRPAPFGTHAWPS
jgi:hypothetical protein